MAGEAAAGDEGEAGAAGGGAAGLVGGEMEAGNFTPLGVQLTLTELSGFSQIGSPFLGPPEN